MRRWAGRLAAAALAAVALGAAFVLAGFLLPAELSLSVEQTVAAPPERLMPLLTTHAGLQRWWTAVPSPEGYPSLAVKHTGGPAEGPGMEVGFHPAGSDVVMETWVLTATDPPRSVEYDVDFVVFVVHRTLTLTPEGSSTRVRWAETAHVGNPLLRWMTTLSGTEGAEQNFRAALSALESAAG